MYIMKIALFLNQNYGALFFYVLVFVAHSAATMPDLRIYLLICFSEYYKVNFLTELIESV